MSPPATARFAALDLLRGVAALAVVFYHAPRFGLLPGLVPHGYLAVDFFFILSGFVVAHAYDGKLDRPGSFWRFLIARMARLYPLAVLGVGVGLVVLLLKWSVAPALSGSLLHITGAATLNLLLLPAPSGAVTDADLFPTDAVLWSLFLELGINIIWATLLRRCRTAALVAVACAGAAGVIWGGLAFGTLNLGYDTVTLAAGCARVVCGFTIGLLVHRWHRRLPRTATSPGIFSRARRLPAAWLLLTALLVLPMARPRVTTTIDGELVTAPADVAGDLLAALVVLPAVVVLGVSMSAPAAPARLLGDLSYPAYALHFPAMALVAGVQRVVAARLPPALLAVGTLLGILVLAIAADRFYDRPVRRCLARRHTPRRAMARGAGFADAPVSDA